MIDINRITPMQKLIIAKGLCDYQYIMDNWQINDDDFQKVYYEFYMKARWMEMSKEQNKSVYFEKLQSINPSDSLMEIIQDLSEKMKKKSYEFSLASKMLHTRNDKIPIYDSKVRDYLSKEENVDFWWQRNVKDCGAPRKTSDKEKVEHDWNLLCRWYGEFLKSPRGIQWIEWFDNNFKDYINISNIKKIDFIIFATN